MLSIEGHTTISLVLNVTFLMLVVGSCFLDYFNFMFEDVQGEVYSSFPNFRLFACSSSSDPGILTVCGNLLNFQLAGLFYLMFAVPLILSLVFCCLNLLMIRFVRANWLARFWYPHVVNAGAFILSSSGFLLISNVDSLEPPDRELSDVWTDEGIPTLFLTAAVAIAALVHYVYLRKYRSLSKVELVAQALVQKFLRLKDPQTHDGRSLEDAERELSALKSEYQRMLTNKQEDVLQVTEDRGQMAGKPSEEGAEFRFDDIEKSSLLGELERLRAEKAAAETALSETLEELERKKAKIAQLKSLAAPESQRWSSDQRKEIDTQKDVYTELVERLEEELRSAEQRAEEMRTEKERKEEIIAGMKRESEELKRRVVALEEESGNMRNHLRDAELSAADIKALRGKLDSEQKRSSLLQEECAQLQAMLTDLSQSKSEQLEDMRKVLEAKKEKEVEALREEAREREKALRTEVERLSVELESAQQGLNRASGELTKSVTAGAEVERLRKQLEDVAARLVHAENAAKQTETEASALRRKLQSAEDELQVNLEKVRSLQDLNAKLLEDLQARHQAEKDRLKRFYEDSLSQELESNKFFYEQKLAKVTGELVLEREEKARLQAQVSGQRVSEESRVDAERMKEAYMKSLQEEVEDLKKMYETNAASLRAERDKLREENATLSSKVAEARKERSKYQKEAEVLGAESQAEQSARQQLSKQLADIKAKYEESQKALETAKKMLDGYKRSADNTQALAMLEKQVQELTRTNNALSAELAKLKEENSDFQQEVRLKEAEIQGMREESMMVHKELFEPKEAQARQTLSRSSSRNSQQSVKETMVIEGMISQHGENPILEKIKQMKREAPMSYSNVWKLFESLLQEKVRLDRLEMSMGRQPRTMTEFMLDFMYLHYGLKSLALKQLKALVLSLQELYRRNHVYGVMFCRFLGLFHPRPLPHHLAIYLLLVHEEFDRLAGKVKVKRPETYAEQYDILQYGGQASIIDAMELVIKICKKNRQAGERIIAQLLPEHEETRIDMILLKVCGTMARLGRDPSYIFELLDRGKGGSIEYHDFVEGIRFSLNIWISQEEAEDLCVYINDRGTGDITYEEWTEKVNFKEYSDKVNSPAAMVSKAALLSALVEEYEYEVVQDYYTLRHMIKYPSLDGTTASEILWQIDPSLDEENVDKLFEEAVEYESDFQGVVSPEAMCIVALRNRVGGFGIGIFGNLYADVGTLDQTLPKPSTEGAISDLIVESRGGGLQVDIMRRPSP